MTPAASIRSQVVQVTGLPEETVARWEKEKGAHWLDDTFLRLRSPFAYSLAGVKHRTGLSFKALVAYIDRGLGLDDIAMVYQSGARGQLIADERLDYHVANGDPLGVLAVGYRDGMDAKICEAVGKAIWEATLKRRGLNSVKPSMAWDVRDATLEARQQMKDKARVLVQFQEAGVDLNVIDSEGLIFIPEITRHTIALALKDLNAKGRQLYVENLAAVCKRVQRHYETNIGGENCGTLRNLIRKSGGRVEFIAQVAALPDEQLSLAVTLAEERYVEGAGDGAAPVSYKWFLNSAGLIG